MSDTIWYDRFESVLKSWQGTPYLKGSGTKGRGADCLRFVVGVIDEMFRIKEPPPEKFPTDIRIYNRVEALSTLREILKRWPHQEEDRSFVLPGDVIVLMNGHILLVGFNKKIWHTTQSTGVCYTSLRGLPFPIAHRFSFPKDNWS